MLTSSPSLKLGSGALASVKVARRPILGAQAPHALLGYRLLFSDSGSLFGAFADVDDHRATTEVVSHSVLTLGLDAIVGPALAFVRFPQAQFVDQTPLVLPPDQSCIELDRDVWGGGRIEDVVARCRVYQQQGYKVALANFAWSPEVEPLAAVADYVTVDVTRMPPGQVAEHLAAVRRHTAEVIATNVDDEVAADLATRAGADYLEGFFFSTPPAVEGRELPGFKLAYLQLLRKAYAEDVDFADLAEVIKTDVALSYKLLRYVNSAQFGLRGRVESVQKALAMLGLAHVQRWVALATVSGLVDPRPQELAVMCATRARFCESLGAELGVASAHECFSLGMFSLLDVMLGRPITGVLIEMPVHPQVRDALAGRQGPLGDLLAVMLAYERGNWGSIATLAHGRAWDETTMISHYIDALEWSRDFFGVAAQ